MVLLNVHCPCLVGALDLLLLDVDLVTRNRDVAASTADSDLAHSVIKFLVSPEAAHAITKSGLEAIGN